MSEFNIHRCLNVCRWDITINRAFYAKAVMFIFLVLALPTVLSLLTLPAREMVTAGYYNASYFEYRAANVASTTQSIALGLLLIAAGYLFHNLSTRQGRINELTLPATNAEKFCSHLIVTLVGTVVVTIVACAVIDAVQYLVIGVYGGFDKAYSYFLVVNLNADAPAPLHVWLLYPSVLSTFVLGNAIRYKHNIIITLGVDIAIAIALFILAMITTGLEYYQRGIDVVGYTPILETKAAEVISTLLIIIAIVACWCQAFRLYSRAQITTRRNR